MLVKTPTLFDGLVMYKNIDIPDNIVNDLKKLAVDSERDLKNYIQDLLIQHVEESKRKSNNLPSTNSNK